MCVKLGWKANEGELGTKLIRRSIAQLIWYRLPESSIAELQIQLGHRRETNETDLYAAFKRAYLKDVVAAITEIIEEIEHLALGAFHRTPTGAPRSGAEKSAADSIKICNI